MTIFQKNSYGYYFTHGDFRFDDANLEVEEGTLGFKIYDGAYNYKVFNEGDALVTEIYITSSGAGTRNGTILTDSYFGSLGDGTKSLGAPGHAWNNVVASHFLHPDGTEIGAGTSVEVQSSWNNQFTNPIYGLTINNVKYGFIPQQSCPSDGIALGRYSRAYSFSVAVGTNANAEKQIYSSHNVAIGYSSYVKGTGGTAIGASSHGSTYSVALGYCAETENYSNSIAIGYSAKSKAATAIAIGAYTENAIPDSVTFDATSYFDKKDRTLLLQSTDSIFFRNEDNDSTKTTLDAYTNGKTLTQVLAGAGGGTKLYKHTISTAIGGSLIIISTDSEPYPIIQDEMTQEYGFEWNNGRPFVSSPAGYCYNGETVLRVTYESAPVMTGASLIGPMTCVPALNSSDNVSLNSSSVDTVTEL